MVRTMEQAAGGAVACEYLVTAPQRETIAKTRFLAGRG